MNICGYWLEIFLFSFLSSRSVVKQNRSSIIYLNCVSTVYSWQQERTASSQINGIQEYFCGHCFSTVLQMRLLAYNRLYHTILTLVLTSAMLLWVTKYPYGIYNEKQNQFPSVRLPSISHLINNPQRVLHHVCFCKSRFYLGLN